MCLAKRNLITKLFLIIIATGPLSLSKAVKCPQMDLFNLTFHEYPQALARLKIAYHEAVNAKTVAIDESATRAITAEGTQKTDTPKSSIKECLFKVLHPIRDFLLEMRRCEFIMKTTLEKCLAESAPKKSHLLKFMGSSGDLMVFFEHEISTKEKLHELCEELCSFIKNVEDNLTPETINRYKEFVSEVKSAKKSAHHEETLALQFLDIDEMHLCHHLMPMQAVDTVPVQVS